MEFLALFVPGGLLFSAFALVSLYADRRLFRAACKRYPFAIEAARGRARRRRDIGDALRMNERCFRSRFLATLAAPAQRDASLAALIESSRRAERHTRRASIVALFVTVALWAAVVLLSR